MGGVPLHKIGLLRSAWKNLLDNLKLVNNNPF